MTEANIAIGTPQEAESDPLKGVIDWDWGTAYDLLLSIHTILRPKEHGLPAPWAAGVRKRLSAQSQQDLKTFFSPNNYSVYTPVHLIVEMDQPKTAKRFLEYVETIPDEDFMRRVRMSNHNDEHPEITEKAMRGERISNSEVEEYRRMIGRQRNRATPSAADMRRLFGEMAKPAETKRRWLSVVSEYYSVFFAEEEERERPVLQRALHDAQALSKTTAVPDLIERLSNGFTISPDMELRRLVLVPSIWVHPFVFRTELGPNELFIAWGTRPSGYKLVPGESVPDEALLVLRALGDPTRLRLLRLIAREPRSLQSLAHEVKLSLPTVSHHIRELRVSGLIRLEMGGRGRESKYTVRWPSAQHAFDQLEEFVLGE